MHASSQDVTSTRLSSPHVTSLAASQARLEAQVKQSQLSKAEESMAAQERRQQASEYALLLKQQEQELQAVREELVAVKQTVRTEEEGRVAAERKAEEAQIQLSVERSNHMKLQKAMRAPRSSRASRSHRRLYRASRPLHSDAQSGEGRACRSKGAAQGARRRAGRRRGAGPVGRLRAERLEVDRGSAPVGWCCDEL